jgi:SET domain-containing protein
MLLVKTKIAMSKINGIGLFADQFIPKGAVIWKSHSQFDIKVPREDVEKLSEPARELFIKYSFFSRRTKTYVLCFDDARFFNHSDNPNVLDSDSPDSDEGVDIAARDIYPGEEMTCDYRAFDDECANMPRELFDGEESKQQELNV